MPPKQATLGRFFSLPAGTKPPVQQQTKLKTAKKGTTKEKEDASKGSVGSEKEPGEALGVAEVEDEEGDTAMAGASEAEGEEMESGKKQKNERKKPAVKKNGAPSRKRGRKPAESESEPEGAGPDAMPEKTDKPVTKRGRLSPAHKTSKKNPTAEKIEKSSNKSKGSKEVESGAVSDKDNNVSIIKRGRPSTPSKSSKKDSATTGESKKSQKAKVLDEEELQIKSEDDDDEPIKKRAKPATKKGAMAIGHPRKSGHETKEGEEKEQETKSGAEEEEGEDEPVTKRGRTSAANKALKKGSSKNQASTAKEIKKLGREVKNIELEVETKVKSETEEDEPIKPRDKPTTKTPSSTKKRAKLVKVEESESKSADEEEDIAGSDDEIKPAIAEKARKAVAKALSGKETSHPYPDWPSGDPTPYSALVKTLTLVEGTTKRLEKLSHASLFLRQVLRLTPDDLLMVIHLMINKLAADYEGVELGIGESLLMKAIGESCGRSMDKIREDQKEIGDLGMVAMKSRNNQATLFKPNPLTITSVHKGLLEIATIKGEGGQGRKIAGIKKLLAAAKGDEAKYLVRGLEGKLRTGLAENTVIVALSQAQIVHEMEAKKEKVNVALLTEAEIKLRSVFSELPSYEVIIPAMAKHGIMVLKDYCKLQPGIPLKPMLAKPTKAISEVLDRFEKKRFTCEYKYDGERAQIHFVSPDSTITYPATSISTTTSSTNGITKVFSRNSEDLSKKYPDILAALDKWVKPGIESFVLDCEAVAWDKDEKRVLPFQQLMTRKKKDVKIEDVKVKVCVFAFDMLFLNGKSLCQETLEERRRLMHTSFTPIEGEFTFATYADANDLEQIQVFLDESVKASCEGLMVKMLDGDESGYEPSKRSRNWLKIKKDYLSGIGDSLDLVVLGAYHGRGKRTSLYGAFLLACYSPNTQTYETICNIGTGFSEANLEEFHKLLSELEIDKPKPYYSHDNGNKQQPDVWFEPKIVWEVKTADLSLSPVYKAAAGMADDTGKGRGISLRFPRFIRVRDDKSSEDATSSSQVADMYRRQEVVTGNSKKGKGVDDDFEY